MKRVTIDSYRQCDYPDPHPPHLWALRTPGGADWIAGCPGIAPVLRESKG